MRNIKADFAGISGNVSKDNVDSKYESVTDQSGIYAGKDGFDIRVETNTDLKGGIISSTADADKNKLSTGTLTFEDIQNKADYKANGIGAKVNKNNNADYNEKGITPDIGMPASGEAESTTKAAISKGTIEIRDKENQKQDINKLNRDTANSLNKLGEIFDKTKVEERQELANLFGELAYNEIHYMDGSNEQKALYHAVVGGIMSKLTGGDFLAGATAAGINKLVIEEVKKAANYEPDKMQWVSAVLGAVVAEFVSGNAQVGGSIASSATKNNDALKAEIAAQKNCTAEEVLKADKMEIFVDTLDKDNILYQNSYTKDQYGNISEKNSNLKDFDFASSVIINGTVSVADLPANISKVFNAGNISGYAGEITYIVAINNDIKDYSGKDLRVAIISDTVGYGVGKGTGMISGAMAGAQSTNDLTLKPILIIYGSYVGFNTMGSVIGDYISSEIKNRFAVSDQEKLGEKQ